MIMEYPIKSIGNVMLRIAVVLLVLFIFLTTQIWETDQVIVQYKSFSQGPQNPNPSSRFCAAEM